MRVVAAEGLFGAEDVRDADLVRLLMFGADGRHHVLLDPPDSEVYAVWLSGQGVRLRDELGLAVLRGLQGDAREAYRHELRVEPRPAPDWTAAPPVAPIDVALRVLDSPLTMLLENFQSDGAFLLAAVPEKYRPRLAELLDRGWARIDHGGGQTAAAQAAEARGDPERRLRTWVLVDGDGLRPGAVGELARRVAEACGDEVPYHRTERRAAENYLPGPALDAWVPGLTRQAAVGMPERVTAFGRLGLAQRSHFNMRSGLGGDVERAAEAGDLYDGVPAADRRVLRRGFGRQVWRAFRPDLSETCFVDDGQGPELDRLFGRLLRLA